MNKIRVGVMCIAALMLSSCASNRPQFASMMAGGVYGCRGDVPRCVIPVYVFAKNNGTECEVKVAEFIGVGRPRPKDVPVPDLDRIEIVWVIHAGDSQTKKNRFRFPNDIGIVAKAGQPMGEFRNQFGDQNEDEDDAHPNQDKQRRFRWLSLHPVTPLGDVKYDVNVEMKRVNATGFGNPITCRVDPIITNHSEGFMP